MNHNFDIDVLKTFIAIADTGSFTGAGSEVNKTQAAVSLQIKRLEEIIGKKIFRREGRNNILTSDGKYLLDYAKRITRLNDEAIHLFTKPELSGIIRLGIPDDYAYYFIPRIFIPFTRTHPNIRVEIESDYSCNLITKIHKKELDMAVITGTEGEGIFIREEPLVWICSEIHNLQKEETLPLALRLPECYWHNTAIEALEKIKAKYKISYLASNNTILKSLVTSGLAISLQPKLSLSPGIKILDETDGMPNLGTFVISLLQGTNKNPAAQALADYITDKNT